MPTFPVPGGTFSNDWLADRDGHQHHGTDIFAPVGTPILAPVSGTITAAGDSGNNAGIRVRMLGDDGRYYAFFHMNAENVEPGQRITEGVQLGGVGNTGNAATTPPHLHFAVSTDDSFNDSSEEGWVNSYEVLTAWQEGGDTPAVGTIADAIAQENENRPDPTADINPVDGTEPKQGTGVKVAFGDQQQARAAAEAGDDHLLWQTVLQSASDLIRSRRKPLEEAT